MARFWTVMVAGVMLCGVAQGQTVQTPSSANMCPITHGCRTVAHAGQQRRAVTATVGPIQCPPGTYQIPNTSKCRVR
jgi:hypothetical protein